MKRHACIINIFHNPSKPKILDILTKSQLHTSDIAPQSAQYFFGCGTQEEPNGVVGLEIYGKVGLLRSLAVTAECRGYGCGKALVDEAERYAQSEGVRELYLLTITAEKFFNRLGYRCCIREKAPGAICRTQQFTGLCPSSSAFMCKVLPLQQGNSKIG